MTGASPSGAVPSEFTAAAILAQVEAGTISRETILSFARGFLPVEGDEVIALLAALAGSGDAEIATTAAASLNEMPTKLVAGFAADESADAGALRMLAAVTADVSLLETVIRNRTFPDDAVASLASAADAPLQEVIVTHQMRILRSPAILEALFSNSKLTPDVRRRAIEIREEFFEKKARAAPEPEIGVDEELADAPLEPIADLLEAAAAEPPGPQPESLARIPESEKSDEKTQALFAKILTMGVAEKVVLAFRGDRSARMLLVRERNKLVCSAAIRNPRMTENEVELIAGLRSVEEEVLRLVGMRRDWISKYNIALALCRNPRTPVGVVLPLINRLTLRDLKGLKDDKGVSEVVRSTARRAFMARAQKA